MPREVPRHPIPTDRSCRVLADFPSEILAYIFIDVSFLDEGVISEDPLDSDILEVAGYIQNSPPREGYRLGWIVVSHVCRRWRAVALENALLWTKISYAFGRHWAVEMMRRARSAPLTVIRRRWFNDGFSDEELESVPNHLSHIRELELTFTSTMEPLLSKLVRPAPILDTLRLMHLEEYTVENDDDFVPLSLPSDFLSNDTPKLRSLKLEGFFISWTSSIFRGITCLKIAFPRFLDKDNTVPSRQYYPSRETLLHFLSGMSQLEHLSLEYALPLAADSEHPPSARVSLPHLRIIRLCGTPRDCAEFFHSLEFPQAAEVRLTPIYITWEHSADHILSILQQHCRRTPEPAYALLVKVFGDELSLQANRKDGSSIFYVKLYLQPSEDNSIGPHPDFHTDYLHLLLTTLPLDNAREFEFVAYDKVGDLSVENWVHALGSMRRLETVTVAGGVAARRLCLALCVDVASYTADLDQPSKQISGQLPSALFLPSLKVLLLKQMYFTDREIEKDAASITLTLMAAILRTRKGWGVQLRRLTLVECDYFSVWPHWINGFLEEGVVHQSGILIKTGEEHPAIS